MKWAKLLKTEPKPIEKRGCNATVQIIDDVLCVNVWDKKVLKCRYFMQKDTYEHGYVDMETGIRHTAKLETAVYGNYEYYYRDTKNKIKFSEEDEREGQKLIEGRFYNANLLRMIDSRESEYGRDRRWEANERKWKRIKQLQETVPEEPDMDEWLHQTLGNVDYMMYLKERKMYRCTACGEKYTDGIVLQANPYFSKVRNNYSVKCPCCGKGVTVKRRDGQKLCVKTRCMVLQKIDESVGVARHFEAEVLWDYDHGRRVLLDEVVRLFIYRNNPKRDYKIFYDEYGDFSTTNKQNKKMGPCYLYPDTKEIQGTLQGTMFESWIRLFPQMAAAGVLLDYNRMMAASYTAGMVEYIYKGRFARLLTETVSHMNMWDGKYYGSLGYMGQSIEEVFGLNDRQKINRLRQLDGGEDMLGWLRWSEKTGRRINDETLRWLCDNGIRKSDMGSSVFLFVKKQKISPEQAMNYIKKQQRDSYPGMSARDVLIQWGDYLSMCSDLKKHMDDEMVYKPRELKRRHDEAVYEHQMRQAQLQADAYSAKFPGAEENLNEIRSRFEYENDSYRIIVPERLVEIVAEGRTLHHCVANTDRYFDRIMQKETYICFLRQKEAPDAPYYTIEVEPGGTIRQHRGYLDEEPDIETVKVFLKEWQRHLRKNMTERDRKDAEKSAMLRQKNIEDLQAKNNTRVLQGLMEDFMDAEELEAAI